MIVDEELTSVVVGDRHTVLAAGVASLLRERTGITVLGVVTTIDELVRTAKTAPVDVAVLGARLADGDAFEATRRVRAVSGQTCVVVLSPEGDDPTMVDGALAAGCSGLLGSTTSVEALVRAVRLTPKGEAFFSRDAMRHVLRRHQDPAVRGPVLSAREVEVLQLVARGAPPARVALDLGLSVHTVRNHLRRLMARLDAPTRLDAVLAARRLGLIDLD